MVAMNVLTQARLVVVKIGSALVADEATGAPDRTWLARGPGLGSDATPRHTAGTRVALRWGPEDERLFDAAGQAIEVEIRETSHA